MITKKKAITGNPFFKSRGQAGFSLVEMIVYTAIFAILFTVILQLFWRVQLSGSRLQVGNEVKENVSQVMQFVTASVRQADSINELTSVFDVHPGTLVLDDSPSKTLDTYQKSVNVGGRQVSIRKLRLLQGADPAVDLTSDHVSVDRFLLTDLSQPGAPDVVQIELEISNINPDNDPDFDNSLSVRSSVSIRKES